MKFPNPLRAQWRRLKYGTWIHMFDVHMMSRYGPHTAICGASGTISCLDLPRRASQVLTRRRCKTCERMDTLHGLTKMGFEPPWYRLHYGRVLHVFSKVIGADTNGTALCGAAGPFADQEKNRAGIGKCQVCEHLLAICQAEEEA